MQKRIRLEMVLLLAAAAHGQAGPGILRGPTQNKALSGIPNVVEASFERLTGDPPGVWTCGLTTFAQGREKVDIGRYDSRTGTVALAREAANLHLSSEFRLMLEPVRGRFCVFERHAGSVRGQFMSFRTGPGVVFIGSVPILGLVNSFKWPAIGYVDGKLHLFYSDRGPIFMQALDISNQLLPQVVGPPITIARPSKSGRQLRSVTPITGPDGDVHGFTFIEVEPLVASTLMFRPGFDPTVPPIPVYRSRRELQRGGVAGGKLLFADGLGNIQEIDTAWLLGDSASSNGGTLEVFSAVVSSADFARTIVLLSPDVRTPIRLPKPLDIGSFALDLGAVIPIASLAHRDASARGETRFRFSGNPRLKGTRAAIQGLTLDLRTGAAAWTNTAWLNIR